MMICIEKWSFILQFEVATASLMGITTGSGTYGVAKHAVSTPTPSALQLFLCGM
jgi:hypothetical protein